MLTPRIEFAPRLEVSGVPSSWIMYLSISLSCVCGSESLAALAELSLPNLNLIARQRDSEWPRSTEPFQKP